MSGVCFCFYFWNMKARTHRILLTFIMLAILTTVALQIHWNVKNYDENKRRLMNDVQIAFDNGVEHYYAEGIKKDLMVIIGDSGVVKKYRRMKQSDSVLDIEHRVRNADGKFGTIRIVRRTGGIPRIQEMPKMAIDVHRKVHRRNTSAFLEQINAAFSLSDTIEFKKLDSLFERELKRKNLSVAYNFGYKKWSGRIYRHGDLGIQNQHTVSSTSPYLQYGYELKLNYADPTSLILQRGITEIILSFIFSLIIIGCLLYLLHIINRQKKIDEIRNDLISNITHEFKTPITTVIAAIEGIRSFNEQDDKEKTNRYLDISERQMGKLQIMVEKLLDTATLETDEIALKKEAVDVVQLLHSVTEKYQLYAGSKVTMIASEKHRVMVNADGFHFENALSNLVDNAIKYGGDQIDIRLEEHSGKIEIFVEDNGDGIDKWHRQHIFEKFYRVPTGNVHNVKGFGIGLFYSRKIIEKHGGQLELVPNNQLTIFKITLPYA
jgi:signal transduction histidine kinase